MYILTWSLLQILQELSTAENKIVTLLASLKNSDCRKFRLRLCNGNNGDGIEKMQVVGTSSDKLIVRYQ
jgi:hypothetical protein